MNRRSPLLLLSSLAASLAGATAVAQTPAAPKLPTGLDCMIQPHLVVQVGTASPGVIQAVRVDRGDLVKRGQAVVLLKADVERAALAVARERASQSGEIASTRGAHDLAQREAQRASQLVDENFVSRTYFDRQRAEVQVAAGRGEQAQERIRLAQREVELAAAQLNQRTVVSPIDGVVVERFVSPGEYVEQKPVLRIAAVDPLRVDVLVPAAQFGRVAVGSKASVVPELLDRRAHPAIVTSVDRVVDAASNTFRVRLELPNPGGVLPPGLRCKAELGMVSSSAAAPVVVGAGPAADTATQIQTQIQTQTQLRRTEPVEPAVATVPRPVQMPSAHAHAQIRRFESAQSMAAVEHVLVPARWTARWTAPLNTPVVAPVAVSAVTSVTSEPPARATPTTPRLKMAPIEWPTALAAITPGP